MNNQQGFIELDGEAVSKAAQKAFIIAKEADDIYNEKLKEKALTYIEEQTYWSEQAAKDFSDAFEELKYEETIEVKVPGVFFDRTTTTKRWNVDIDRMIERLAAVSEHWDTFSVIEARRNKLHSPEYNFFMGKVGRDPYFYRFGGYSHLYFKQFFDLKGKVLLPLEQYQKLKPYME